jgi:hypothetical protein
MIRQTSIKAIHMARLMKLRDEMFETVQSNERKRKALINAERYMMTWETEKLRTQPLRRMK